MIGKQFLKFTSDILNYRLEFIYKFNIITGNSATGKTTLYDAVRLELLNPTGSLECSCKCICLDNLNWVHYLESTSTDGYLFIIDESFKYINSKEFIRLILHKPSYFIIINRDSIEMLPYSVNAVYTFHKSGKYITMRSLLESNSYSMNPINNPDVILTEDSNSGYEFFYKFSDERSLVVSTNGKSNIVGLLNSKFKDDKVFVVVDGAAFGSCLNKIMTLLRRNRNIYLFTPESFEYILLCHPYFKLTDKILDKNYIAGTIPLTYPSWEQYFTEYLIKITSGTPFEYSKSKLNKNYINDGFINTLVSIFPELDVYSDNHYEVKRTSLFK